MKKLVCLVLAIVMLVAVAACASAEFKFERKIDIVCPWGVGGGADSTLRPMANLLQEILGVPVNVVNVEGAAGVNGVEYTYKQPADGYTFMLGTQSLFMQDMAGTTSMNFKEEFQPIDVLFTPSTSSWLPRRAWTSTAWPTGKSWPTTPTRIRSRFPSAC